MREWNDMRSLLAVRLDGMGDLLMTTPALRAIKESVPARRLTLLTSAAGAMVARGLPFIDAVMVYAAPWVKNARVSTIEANVAVLDRLRAAAYDGAIVFTVCTQSALPAALMLLLAGVPRRLAYARENPYELLTDWLPDPDRDVRSGVRHEVQRQLDLVAYTGAQPRDTRLCYPVTELDRQAMMAKARAAGADGAAPWIVVHPGATAASRRYPVESLAAVVARLASYDGWQIVFAGGDEDRATIAALARHAPTSVRLAGALSFGELVALIERSRVVLCNNSSPAHVAAAVGTPVVDLYAQTNPQHTPWQVPHRTLFRDVPCRGCLKSVCPEAHHRCLAGVSPDEVVEAVHAMYHAPIARAA